MQVLDTINEIDRCLEALQHKLEYLRGCVSGSLYQVDQLMTRKEAAAFICKTPRHLDRLCAENKITKEIVDGQIRIRKSSLMRYKCIIITEEKRPEEMSELEQIISRIK